MLEIKEIIFKINKAISEYDIVNIPLDRELYQG